MSEMKVWVVYLLKYTTQFQLTHIAKLKPTNWLIEMKFVSAICKSLLFKFEIVSIAPAGSPNWFKEQILVCQAYAVVLDQQLQLLMQHHKTLVNLNRTLFIVLLRY